VPKLEIFGFRVFTQIRPSWVGDLGIVPKNQNFDGLGLKIAIFVFLTRLLLAMAVKIVKCCRRQRLKEKFLKPNKIIFCGNIIKCCQRQRLKLLALSLTAHKNFLHSR